MGHGTSAPKPPPRVAARINSSSIASVATSHRGSTGYGRASPRRQRSYSSGSASAPPAFSEDIVETAREVGADSFLALAMLLQITRKLPNLDALLLAEGRDDARVLGHIERGEQGWRTKSESEFRPRREAIERMRPRGARGSHG